MGTELINTCLMIAGPAASFWLGIWYGKREAREDAYNAGYKAACKDIDEAKSSWAEINRTKGEDWDAHEAGYPNDYVNRSKCLQGRRNFKRNHKGGTNYRTRNKNR